MCFKATANGDSQTMPPAGRYEEAGESAHWSKIDERARRAAARCPQWASGGHGGRPAARNLWAQPALHCLHCWRSQCLEHWLGPPQKVTAMTALPCTC